MGCGCRGGGKGGSRSLRGMTYTAKTKSNRVGGLTANERKRLELQIRFFGKQFMICRQLT